MPNAWHSVKRSWRKGTKRVTLRGEGQRGAEGDGLPQKPFHKQLEDRRSALGVSLDTVAHVAGVAGETVRRAERGRKVSAETQAKISRALAELEETARTGVPIRALDFVELAHEIRLLVASFADLAAANREHMNANAALRKSVEALETSLRERLALPTRPPDGSDGPAE